MVLSSWLSKLNKQSEIAVGNPDQSKIGPLFMRAYSSKEGLEQMFCKVAIVSLTKPIETDEEFIKLFLEVHHTCGLNLTPIAEKAHVESLNMFNRAVSRGKQA